MGSWVTRRQAEQGPSACRRRFGPSPRAQAAAGGGMHLPDRLWPARRPEGVDGAKRRARAEGFQADAVPGSTFTQPCAVPPMTARRWTHRAATSPARRWPTSPMVRRSPRSAPAIRAPAFTGSPPTLPAPSITRPPPTWCCPVAFTCAIRPPARARGSSWWRPMDRFGSAASTARGRWCNRSRRSAQSGCSYPGAADSSCS